MSLLWKFRAPRRSRNTNDSSKLRPTLHSIEQLEDRTVPTAAASVVSPAALSGMQQLYAVNDNQFDFNDAYLVNNSASIAAGSFSRVAYFVELGTKWVWVSMDTFNPDDLLVGVPKAGSNIVQNGTVVNNIQVESSAGSGVTPITGMGNTGIIEFWASNYDQNGGGAFGSSNSAFDWKDSGGSTGSGHGSFQVFAFTSPAQNLANCIFGITANGGSGIGNQSPAGSNNSLDWTFGPTSASYGVRNLEIWVGNGNPPPTITNLGGDTLTYTPGTGAQVLDQGTAALADDPAPVGPAGWNGGNLTVSIPTGGVAADDVLGVRHQGAGAGQIGFAAGTVSYQGTPIGTAVGGTGGANLVITFNNSATSAAVSALVSNITFLNANLATTPTTRTARFRLTDGNGSPSTNSDVVVAMNVGGAVTTRQWDGNSDGDGDGVTWSDPLNWAGNIAPDANDIAQFTGLDTGAVTLSAATFVGAISFTNNGAPYTIGGSGTLQLAALTDFVAQTGTTGNAISNNISFNGGSVTVVSGTTLTLSGNLTAPGGLDKNGAGVLALGGANAYTGATNINDGTLKVGSASNVIPDASAVTIAGSAFLDLNGISEAIGALLGSGIVTSGVSGTPTLTIGGGNAGGGFSGVIQNGSGTVALTKVGTGTQTLTGANTYGGATAIQAGAVVLGGGADRLPAGTALTLGAGTTGGSLDLGGQNQTLAGFASSGSGISRVVNSGAGAPVLTVNVASGTNTFAGILGNTAQNSFSLVKGLAGTLVLSGANTFTGSTTINGGTVSIAADSGLGTAPGAVVANHLTLANGGALNATAAFTLSANRGITLGTGGGTLNAGAALTYAGVITGGTGLTKTGTSDLILTGTATLSVPGTIQINGGRLFFQSQNGLGTGAINIASGGTLNYLTGAALALTNVVTIASGGNIASRPAQLTVANAVLPTSGTLIINQDDQNTSTVLLSSNIPLSGALEIRVGGGGGNGGLARIDGLISNNQTLTKTQTGVLWLNNAGNSFDGALNISAGTVRVTQNGALGTTLGATNVAAGAMLQFDGGVNYTTTETVNITGGTIANLSGNNIFNGSIPVTTGATLRSDAGNLTLNGQISSGAVETITKTGAGSVTAAGNNTYGGPTNILAGTLVVASASGLGLASGGTSVGSGASLGLSGGVTLSGEAVTATGIGAAGQGAIVNVAGTNVFNVPLTSGDLRIGALSGTLNYTGDITAWLPNISFSAASGATINMSGRILESSVPETLNGVTGELEIWLDASDINANGSAVANGALVSSWKDKSGKGRNFDGLIGDPNYVAVGTNGRPTVNFDGNDALQLNAAFNPRTFIDGNGEFTLISVARYSGSTMGRVIGARTSHNWLFGFHGGSTNRNGHYDNWGSLDPAPVGFSSDQNWHLHANQMNVFSDASNPAGDWHRDGLLVTDDSRGTSDAFNNNVPDGLELGGYNGSTEMSTAEVSEFLMYNRALTNSELYRVEAYLAAKYNFTFPSRLQTGVTKLGAGTVNLSGDNTYTVPTTVGFGTLVVSHPNALGTTAAGTTVNAGATLGLSGGVTVGDAISATGNGAAGQPGAIANLANTNTLGGTISSIEMRVAAAAGTTLNIAGDINTSLPNITFDAAAGAAINLSGKIVDAGPLPLGGVTAELEIWLDASDINGNGTAPANGAVVTNWKDKSGKARNFDVVLGDPNYVAAGTNGRPTVNFDGNDALQLNPAYNPRSFIDGNGEFTIIAVARYAGATRGRVIAPRTGHNWLFGYHGGSSNRNGYYDGWASQDPAPVGFSGDENWHLHSNQMNVFGDANDPAGDWRRDGVLVTDNSRGTGDAFANNVPDGLQLGAWNGTAEASMADVSELLMFNRALSDNELYRIESYLAAKYNFGFSVASQNNVTKTGLGTVTFSGDNNYTVPTIVSAGTLVAAHANALGTTAAGTTVASGATLGFSGTVAVGAEPVVVNGLGAAGQPGVLANISGVNSFAGPVTAVDVGGGSIGIGSTAGTLTLSGNIDQRFSQVVFNGAGNVVVSGSIGGLGVDQVTSNQLKETWYPNLFTDANLFGTGNFPGNSPGYLTQTPGSTTYLSSNTNLSFNTSQLTARSGIASTLAGFGNRFGAVWQGTITVGGLLPAGNVSFGTNSDDGSAIYVDTNQNHVFESSELVVNYGGNHGAGSPVVGTRNLAAGVYDIYIGYYESSGGGSMEARFASGSAVAYTSQTIINPGAAAQAGIWSTVATVNNAVVKNGAGTVTLTGNNTYNGGTALNSGLLVVGNNNALGTQTNITVPSGASLGVQGDITLSGRTFMLNGVGAPGQPGALVNVSGNNTIAATNPIVAQVVSLGQIGIGSTAGTLTIDAGIDLKSSKLVVDGAGATVINGVISGTGMDVGANPPENAGAVTGVFANVPEASNYILVHELTAVNNVNGSLAFPYTRNNTATVQPFDRIAYYMELQSGAGPLRYVYASMDAFTTNINLIGIPNGSTLFKWQQTVANMNVFSNAAGIVTGTGIATGNIEIWPSNYAQGNDINIPGASAGTFDFGDGGSGTGLGYGSFQVHNYGASQVLMAYNNWRSGSGDLGIGNQVGGSGNPDYTFANNLASYSVRRMAILVHETTPRLIQTSNSLTKQGSGTLTLSAANTYNAGTTLAAGTLLATNTTGSATGPGTVVANGGILGSNGSLAGTVTTNNGATVAPGSSPAILNTTVTNFTGGANYSVEIGGTNPGTQYDQLHVTSSVNLGGSTLAVNLINGYAPANGTTFVIINNDGPGTVAGTFAGVPEGGSVSAGGRTFKVSYDFNAATNTPHAGNDVALTVDMPTIQFSSATFSAGEGAGLTMVVTLTRTGNTTFASQVEVDLTGGSATAGTALPADYLDDFPKFVTFAPGATSASVAVTIFDDAITDEDETIGLVVTGTSNAVIGAQNTATLTIIDNDNTLPTANAGGPYTVGEGGSVTLSSAASVDPDGTLVLFEWDRDDNGSFETTGASPTFDAAALGYDGLTPAVAHTVRLRVTDNKGGTNTTTTTVTVTNVNPTINTFTVPPSASENDTVNLLAAATDAAGALDPLVYSWTVTGPGIVGSLSLSGTAPNFLALDNGTYNVSLTVTDGDGGSATQSAAVLVANVNPNFELGPDETLPLNVGSFSRTGLSFTDPGPLDTWTATVNYGDGSGTVALPLSGKTFSLAHNYVTPTTYTVTVVVTDDDLGSYTESFTVTIQSPTVVYVDDRWGATGTDASPDPKSPGDSIVDADPVSAGNQPAVFGFNAFALPNAAVAAVAAGGNVYHNAGTYNEAAVINKTLTYHFQEGPITLGSLGDTVATAAVDLAVPLTVGGNNGSTSLTSPVSGGGSLTKEGAGVMTLTGPAANTYTGGTTVNDGTLALAKTAGVAALAGPVTIGDAIGGSATVKTAILRVDVSDQVPDDAKITFVGNDGRLLIAAAADETIAAPTFAEGDVKIAGALTTTTPYNQATGSTTLTGTGRLTVGPLGTMAYTLGTSGGLADSAVLQGSGTIFTGMLTTYGTIDPSSGASDADVGNASPGTITIRGNLQMTAGSVTNLDVGPASDHLNVGINTALALPAGSYTNLSNYDLDPYLRGDVLAVTEPGRRGVNDIYNVNGTVRFHGTLNTRPIQGSALTSNVTYGNAMNFVWRALNLPMNGYWGDLNPRGGNLSSVPSDFTTKNSLDAGGLLATAVRFDQRYMGSAGQFNAVGQAVAFVTKFNGNDSAGLTAPAYSVGQAKALTLTSLTSSATVDTTAVKVTKQLWNAMRDSHTRVTLTITNTSAATVSGPIYVELVGVPAGATVFNAAGKRPSTGKPYLVVPAASLAAGAAVTMEVDLLTPLTLGKTAALTMQVLRGGMP